MRSTCVTMIRAALPVPCVGADGPGPTGRLYLTAPGIKENQETTGRWGFSTALLLTIRSKTTVG